MAGERTSRCSIPNLRDGLQRAIQRHALATRPSSSPGRNVAGDAAAPRHDLVSCRHGHPAAVDEAPATRGLRGAWVLRLRHGPEPGLDVREIRAKLAWAGATSGDLLANCAKPAVVPVNSELCGPAFATSGYSGQIGRGDRPGDDATSLAGGDKRDSRVDTFETCVRVFASTRPATVRRTVDP